MVTDGVFILENAYYTDALLAQCRNSTAVVSFLQVGTGFQRASVEWVKMFHKDSEIYILESWLKEFTNLVSLNPFPLNNQIPLKG